MRLIKFLLITTTLFLVGSCNAEQLQTEAYQLPTAAGLRLNDARGPDFLKYSINLIIALNSSLTLSTLNQSSAIYWILNQYTNETFWLEQENKLSNPQSIRLPLFNIIKPSVRNSTIRSQYMCTPTEQDCNQLTVPRFGFTNLGTFSNQAQIENVMDSIFVDYNVSTFINHVELNCNSGDCFYNKSSQVLSTLSGKNVSLECSVIIAQNSLYQPAAELNIYSEFNECSGDTQIDQIPTSEVTSYINTTTNVNVVLYKLSQRCYRTFTKFDSGKPFTCELKSKNQSAPPELQKFGVLDILMNKLDVQYEPELKLSSNQQLNKTLIAGQGVSTSFSCPFESNPAPMFEWRVKSVVYNNTESGSKRLTLTTNEFSRAEKEFQIPKDLEIGFYQFECRAIAEGLVNKVSQVVTFNLNVIAPPVSAKKDSNNNVGAIIGGVIGGVVGLVLVVLLVLLLIRRSRNSGSKDEIEKAKELEIDINDGNPHLSSRTSLTTNNSSKQSQSNGVIGQKVIAGLMVPSSTAQSYAAIAHAAAAAANQQRNQFGGNQIDFTSSGSSQNLAKSYNNPGFFETGSYTNQNPLESPPPYDAALHQPNKNQQQQQQLQPNQLLQQQQQQQKDYMGSSSRLLPGSTTPQVQKTMGGGASLSYTATPQHNLINSTPNGLGNSMQHLQYTTVQNLARNRNPLNGLNDQIDPQQQQQTQYTTMAQLNPIDV